MVGFSAQGCDPNNLPGGKLTVEYLMKYPNEVIEMLKDLDEKQKNYFETGGYKEEIIEIYQEMKK